MSRRLIPVLLAVLATACVGEPVTWSGEPYRVASAEAVGALTFAANRAPGFTAPAQPAGQWTVPDLCAASVRYARAAGRWFAAGWIERDDGSALLAVGRSVDSGRTWAPPVAVDSLDLARAGCARPAPGVAADSATGYAHVVYFLVAPEGPGVFFSHSMDGGELFHEPVPIVYGARPSRASVAVWRDTVAVAYEDPNSGRPRVSLALSRTMGHTFEEWILVSNKAVAAIDPHVALRGGRVAVAWTESDAAGSEEVTRGRAPAAATPATVVIRAGEWR